MNKYLENVEQVEKFPAGEYVIGDLCYIIPDEMWGEFLDIVTDGEVVCMNKNSFVFWDYTNYGDGEFELENCYDNDILSDMKQSKWGNNLPVDAGLIGIISMEFCIENGIKVEDCNIKVLIKHEFVPNSDNGDFDFNGLTISTQEEEEEDFYI